MEHTSPIVPKKNLPRGVYEDFRRLSRGVQLAIQGLSSVSRGDSPDSSGTTLPVTPDLTQYLYLPGRSGGQTANGGTGSSDQLVLRGTSFSPSSGLSLTIPYNTGCTIEYFQNGASGTLAPQLNLVYHSTGATCPSLKIFNGTTAVAEMGGVSSSGYMQISHASAGYTFNVGISGSTFRQSNAANPSVIIQAAGTPTSNLVEYQTSGGGSTMSAITKDGYFSTKQLLLNGSTSGTLTMIPAVTTTSHSLTWPSAQGAASSVLQNNGSGTLSWASASSIFDLTANYTMTGLWTFKPSTNAVAVTIDGTNNAGANLFNVTIPGATLMSISGTDGYTTMYGVSIFDSALSGQKGTLLMTAAYGTNTYTFPEMGTAPSTGGAGTICVSGDTTTAAVIKLGTGALLTCNTATLGTSFFHTSATTQKLRFVLSAAVGNNHIDIKSTSARGYSTKDFTSDFALVGGTAVTGGNSPSAGNLGKCDLTSQTNSIAATGLLTGGTGTAGMYEVSVYAVCTTAGNIGDIMDVNVTWNDGVGSHTETMFSDNVLTTTLDLHTIGNFIHGFKPIYIGASTNVTFTTTVTKAGSPQYDIHARITAL